MQNESTNNTPENPFTKPVLAWSEFWDMVGVTNSTALKLAASPDAPRFFLISRKRHIRLSDALDWIDHMAEAHPYTPKKRGGAAK